MVLLTSRSYKAWKSSPPPRPGVILEGCKHLSLVRQVSYEDLESTEPSPKYFKGRLESRNHILHSNESRPYPTRALQPKQSKETTLPATRLLWGVIGAASVVNLLVVGLYIFFSVSEHSKVSSFDSYLLRSGWSNTHSNMVYLGEKYNIISESPYPNQLKHREVYDQYPSEQTDATQLYGSTSSNDVRLKTMERKIFPRHETNRDCVPMSQWQFMSFPTCNVFHEMEMAEQRMLSSGNWRDTWLRESGSTNTITKTLKYKHTFQERYFEFSRVDALAMERLTSNPYIMRAYGFCGVSVITEQGKRPLGFVVGQLSSRDKLVVSLQVALSIAAVHEIDEDNPASLVHNDINIDNIFWGDSGPLLNDFNIAVLMMKDKQTNKSCSFTGHFPNPQWKSPEEQSGPDGMSLKQLDEKVDIYALGNLLFRFATGEGPWREYATSTNSSLTSEQKQEIARLKSEKGATPSIPKETADSDDPYTKVMLEAMKRCYRFNPKDRPTARGIARFLQMSLEDLDGIQDSR